MFVEVGCDARYNEELSPGFWRLDPLPPHWLLSLNNSLRVAPVWAHLVMFIPLGIVSGWLVAQWTERMFIRESGGLRSLPPWARTTIIAVPALIFPGLVLAVVRGDVHWITEGGSVDWALPRLLYHFILIALLLAATAIDLDQYLIPDQITVPGVLLGIGIATGVGNMQLMHAWVDWNQVDFIQGPYIPDWIKFHPHWHGLTFSLAGLSAGAGITWLARVISRWALGIEALGFGDVTLMAMIGSFLGWQPVVFVFLLAPLCGVVIAVVLRLAHGRRILPYGPFLSAAAVVVLFLWRWLWTPTREIFGHWPTLVGLLALVTLGMAGLLGLLRLYRAIPVERRTALQEVEDQR
jgi:leader peptidase (prepilin peptidase)/N-methyltransferase